MRILQDNGALIQERLGGMVRLVRVADIDWERDRGMPLPVDIMTRDAGEVVRDPDISVVVESMGGHEPARSFILEALEKGKDVVTANKALLALHGRELFSVAQRCGVRIGFEASVGGGIPIIRAVRDGLVANRISSIFGILNGTSNYILSTMTAAGRPFSDVLREAQQRGYAEADPTLDVEGIDAAHKLAIVAGLAFGADIEFTNVFVEGISRITPLDLQYSAEFGYRVKLLAIGKWDDGKVELRVHPTMIPKSHLLATVEGVFNAIYVTGDAVGPTMFYGQGAGSLPTGSAVVSDLVDVCRDRLKSKDDRAAYVYPLQMSTPVAVKDVDDVRTPCYLRFTALDRPGVLSKISGILGACDISIESVIQKGRRVRGTVPIVMMTHEATERNIRRALQEIDGLDVIKATTMLIRVEGSLA